MESTGRARIVSGGDLVLIVPAMDLAAVQR